MSNPQIYNDPAELTPDERHREIAAILARGMLQLSKSRRKNPPESGDAPLEVPDKTVLSVSRG